MEKIKNTESFQQKLEPYNITIKMCQDALGDGKNREDLSRYGWPLYNIIRYKVGDKENSLGLVPADVWDAYKDMREMEDK